MPLPYKLGFELGKCTSTYCCPSYITMLNINDNSGAIQEPMDTLYQNDYDIREMKRYL